MGTYGPGRPVKYNPTNGRGVMPFGKPGEYRIRDNNGNIRYIGETDNLARRTKQHINSGKLGTTDNSTIEVQYSDGRSTSCTRREHEKQKIKQHNPLLNKSKGGEGRIAGKRSQKIAGEPLVLGLS